MILSSILQIKEWKLWGCPSISEASWSTSSQPVRFSPVSNLHVSETTVTVKYVPQWVPGAGFQKVASEWRRVVHRVINEPYEYGKASFVR